MVKQHSKVNETFNFNSDTEYLEIENVYMTINKSDELRYLFDDENNTLPEPLSISKVECLGEIPLKIDQKYSNDMIPTSTNDNQLFVFTYARDKLLMLSGIRDFINDEDKKYQNDPYMVSDYAIDIFFYMNYVEEKFRISKSFLKDKYVTADMRAKLVDWLVCINDKKFKFLNDTIYLCIQLLDAFLQVIILISLFNYHKVLQHKPCLINK